MKPISLQPYTLRTVFAEREPLSVLQEIADIGYAGIEGYLPGYAPAEFRRIANDLGMQVSSWYGPIPTPENLNEITETLEALGTKYLTGGFWIPDLETADLVKENGRKLNESVKLLANRGITYALHNHWMEYEDRDGRLVMDILLEACPDLQLELDIYWASNFGRFRPVEITERFRDRIALMHVKDGPLVRDQPMLPAGQGRVDVDACIHAANPAWLIVELDEYAGDMMTAVRESYRYLTENGLAKGNR